MRVPLLLLAAGRSTRFGTLKQVAPVGPGGASILAYTAADALLAGFSDLVVVVRPEIDAVVRGHLEQHLGPGLPIRFVHQPQAHGTGQAALIGLAGIDGPAALANGDDAYGREALTQLRRSATLVGESGDHDGPVRCAIVAFPILGTLSEHGGVSRGWVQADGGDVASVDEVYHVRSVEEEGAPPSLRGRSADGEACVLPRDALGSMNLWMLGPGIRPLLDRAFARYQRQAGDEEFALPIVLGRLRRAGDVAIRLAGTADGWFGLTFAADLPAATRRMQALHRDGHYADSLAEMVDPFRTRSR